MTETVPTAPRPFFEQDLCRLPSARLRLANLALRSFSLLAKLGLTLFMGKFFSLDALGAYGLVFAAVMIANSFLGQNLGYVAMREIVGANRQTALRKIRDQAVWHALNYVFLGLLLAALARSGLWEIQPSYYLFIFILSVTENLGTMLHYCMNARNQQLAGNAMLFMRAAAWVPLVIGLGLYDPAFRSEQTVLTAWAGGSALALFFPLWLWRSWDWRGAIQAPINWSWLNLCVRKSLPIWIGLMGTIAGGYLDRYAVGHFLDLGYVGVMTFFYSFINACYPLLESGLLSFATTRLIDLNNRGDQKGFAAEAAHTMRQTTLGALVLVLGLGVCVPVLCLLLGREAFLVELPTFWLLAASMLISGPSLAAATILFARHKDRSLWLGNILYLLPVLICNFTLVPFFGFPGIAYSALLSAFFLFIWRLTALRTA